MGITQSRLSYNLTETDFINITNDFLSNNIVIKKCEYYILTHNNGTKTVRSVIINNDSNNSLSLFKILDFDKKSSKEFIKLYNNYNKIDKYDEFTLDNRKCLKLKNYIIFYNYSDYKGFKDMPMPIICNIKPDIKIKYDKVWIGKDINIRNNHLPPYFGYGNTIMYQKSNKLYTIHGIPIKDKDNADKDNADNPIYILDNEEVIGYFSPIDNNDVPIPIILTTAKIIVLFDKIYKFTAKDINYNDAKITRLVKNNSNKLNNELNTFYNKIIDKIIN